MRLVLHDHGARQDRLALDDIKNVQACQNTAAQLAIHSKIEQCQIAHLFRELEPYPDGPDLFEFQWCLLR